MITSKSSAKRLPRMLSVLLLLVLLIPAQPNASGLASATLPEGQPFKLVEIPPEALQALPETALDQAVQAKHPKLDGSLAALLQTSSVPARNSLIDKLGLRALDDRVQVQISFAPGKLDLVRRAVMAAGGQVTKASSDASMLQAWLPLAALEELSAHADVFQMQRPAQLTYFDTDVGTYTTEGLAALNGAAWHSAGINGQGVKIGVIDGGFAGYLGLLGSDLPATVAATNFVDGETAAQLNTGSEHGTACAEIIYDVAPGATLYLAKIATVLDLVEAVTWLRDTVQVDVISSSIGFYNVSPGDGTGLFEGLVYSARNAGILWVTAAGNDQQVHWGGSFFDVDSDFFHDYDNEGSNINYFGPGGGNAYLIPAGYPILVYMRWDDWTQVNQDYELYLFSWTSSEGWTLVAGSTNTQDGSAGQSPTEAIYVAAPKQAVYGFVVRRYQAARAVNLEIFAPKMSGLQYRNPSRSLANLADSASAMTVAALDVNSPYPLEPYSSQGPTNGPGGTAAGGFIKPDISAYANVSTVSYGTENRFNGTSSATPHTAGAAALVLDYYPNFTPDLLQTFLQNRAVDMGAAGKDSIYGSGRLYLGAPPQPTVYLPFIRGK
jgi:subtilisin family serine protease